MKVADFTVTCFYFNTNHQTYSLEALNIHQFGSTYRMNQKHSFLWTFILTLLIPRRCTWITNVSPTTPLETYLCPGSHRTSAVIFHQWVHSDVCSSSVLWQPNAAVMCTTVMGESLHRQQLTCFLLWSLKPTCCEAFLSWHYLWPSPIRVTLLQHRFFSVRT